MNKDIDKMMKSIKGLTDSSISNITNPMPKYVDHMAPPRRIAMSQEDTVIVNDSIASLKKSSSKKEKLFQIFDDWQTKRTLTAKRILMSTSIIVAAASWIGIDYMDLSLFGLKIASGNPQRFIIFILFTILLSGLFYEVSRRLDLTVRKAKIINVSQDIETLKEPVEALDLVMKRNNISSFRKLYFDFQSLHNQDHDAIHAFNAVHFYRKHLEDANKGFDVLAVTELVMIYLIAGYACIALTYSLLNA